MEKPENVKLKVSEAETTTDINRGWIDKEGNFTAWEDMSPDHYQRVYKSLKQREFAAQNRVQMFCNMAELVESKAKEKGIVVRQVQVKAKKGAFGMYFDTNIK